MVAFFCFFDHQQMLRQRLLAGPGRAVDALQHLVAMVAAPIRTRHLHQLEMFETPGAGNVRAPAQVFELALAVKRHVFAGRNRRDDFGLVGLAQALEVGHRLVARQHAPFDLFVLACQFRHLGFDGRQVFGRERALVGKVVEEAVLDHRADRHLGVGKQFLHCIGEQVRRRMADHLQTGCVFVGDDCQRCVRFETVAQVDDTRRAAFADAAGQRRLGQAGADACGHLRHRHRGVELAFGAVRQLN